MRRIITEEVISSDVIGRLKDIDSKHPNIPTFILLINSSFKDEGWVDYLLRRINLDEMVKDFRKLLERYFYVARVVTTANFDIIGFVKPKNIIDREKFEKLLDELEIEIHDFLLSDKYIGRIKKQVDIFTTPFKSLAGFSIGFSQVSGYSEGDIVNAVNIAFMSAKNRKNLKMEAYTKELLRILNDRDLRSVFQPIIDIKDGKVISYEALLRGPKGSLLESPAMLFKIASYNNLTTELDKLAIEIHVGNFLEFFKEGRKLSLNLGPTTPILIDEVERKLRRYEVPSELIVWEISEKTYIDDFPAFSRMVDFLVSQGYSVAVDDLGAGFTSFKVSFALNPDFVKIDRDLIKDVDKEDHKKTVLYKLIKCFYSPGMNVVAEGVENEKELYELYKLGYRYYQGFLFSKPMEKVPAADDISKMINSVYNSLDLKNVPIAFDLYYRSSG